MSGEGRRSPARRGKLRLALQAREGFPGGIGMRRIVAVVSLLVATVMPAAAQETPTVEVFAGGMYFKGDAGGKGVSLGGWNLSVAENVNHWFGGAIDVSGAYGSPAGIREFEHSIVGGPVFSHRKGSLTPFAHTMLGAIRNSRGYLGASVSATRFTGVFGGGLDWKIREHIAIRIVQADYQVTPYFNQKQDNFRVSAGVVLRWGKK